ncbi:MAG: YbaB/EbfC family nucleoid-associated protein [Alphaproteobacteria bacterium]|nr:YbaB/EbfC family nucleoid-associated protein [Alphaproteobacteria bacterium]
MKNLGNMLKQAQQMQTRMAEMQERLGELEVLGQSGAGMVQIAVNGRGEMKRVKLAKEAVSPDEIEMLEDLIVAAFNDAKGKIEGLVAEETQKLMGGLKLPPGMKLPF